ncbi:plus-3-domain-containing protein [Anaeromyces robustus]|uniref:Plus-3-domain-containing protein n=1 Tax=Anaeromyces robustus TaxID=1754192 RepID=A0A1Y1XG49_9FUNG|nr:plus-3-domain-containing protein [Anaeromyces robustus]|eukprot:ORX84697.1 plus-3-domain-containing protein [Anaeromyces robustus]
MDLDDEILALAGDSPVRSRAQSRRESKRSRSVSLSGDESDDASLSDSEASLAEEVETYGPDLIIDEEDRKRLDNLPERERELIISERAEKKQILMERLEVKRMLKKEGKKNRISSSRHSTRRDKLTEKEKKSESLSDLKRKREKKRSKLAEKDDNDRRRNTWSDSESEDNYEAKEAEQEVITLEELNSVRISRDELEQWVYTSFFNKTVIGAYCRLGIGFDSNKKYIYRITKILDVVDYHRTYKINKTTIKKALILEHGKAKKRFGMDIISNGPFTEQEYNRYLAVMKNEQQQLPTKDFVKEKKQQIQEARDHKFTGEEISEMVEEKKQLLKAPLNFAVEKANLLLQKDKAEELGNEKEVELINSKLDELNNMKDEKSKLVDEKLDNWTKLNERNRKMNMIENRKAEVQAAHERKKLGNRDDFDPFARRKCMPSHVVATKDDMSSSVEEEKIEEPEVPDSAVLKVNAQVSNKQFSVALIEGDEFNVEIDPKEVTIVI